MITVVTPAKSGDLTRIDVARAELGVADHGEDERIAALIKQAIVRALTIEQLVGAIAQQQFFLITSPTFIYRAQWPGGKPEPVKGSIIEPSDFRIPNTNDVVFVRGAQKAVQRVAPVFDRGECIRLELTVLG